MKTLASKGIILRRTEYGEADRIITFLTPDQGKVRVMAKGVRKAKSKLAGGIELFSVSEIHFIKGRGDIDTLVSSRLIKHYGEIVKDFNRTETAYKMLKVIDKSVEDTAGEDYFVVLNEGLAALDSHRISPVVADSSFVMRMLQLFGHVPDFAIDSRGRSLDPEDQYEFDFEMVGFVPTPNGPFNKNHLKVLKLLAYNSPQSVSAVQGIVGFCEELQPLLKGLSGQYLPH